MTEYSVFNGHEEIRFIGERLGYSSTETPTSNRWTEIEIYRTNAGKYIIHRIGVSLVYHARSTRVLCDAGVKTRFRDLPTDSVPCQRCRPEAPNSPEDAPSDYVVNAELDRHTADICDAGEVRDQLSLRHPSGQTFLSTPAKRALDQALAADAGLRSHVKSVRWVK